MGRRDRRADHQEQAALLRQPRAPGRQSRTARASSRRGRIYDFAIAEDRTDWNTMIRVDHQISSRTRWAVRWLREWAPQWYTIGNRQTPESYQDETDLDQTAVGTLTSVIGNTRVNTVRVARTWEHWWHGNACFRAQGPNGDRAGFKFGEEADGQQALCPPQLNYLELPRPGQHRIAGAVGLELPDRGRLLVVRSRQEGRSRTEVRRALQLHRAAARLADQRERHVHVQQRSAVRRRQSAHLSGAAVDPDGHVQRVDQEPHASSSTRRTSGRSAAGPR